MRVAGIGCRRSCPAADIVALVRAAGAVHALAAPAWKSQEPGLLEAAQLLNLPLLFVEAAVLTALQPRCPTHSPVVQQAVGLASVAEAAALSHGGRLVQQRTLHGMATCAVAEDAHSLLPLPPAGEGRGEGNRAANREPPPP